MFALKIASALYICLILVTARTLEENNVNQELANRLTKVETILDLVLEKNVKLEKQVQHLEASKAKRQLIAATVAFTAVITPESIILGPGQTLVFDQTVTNLGGHYQTTTGIFTAPVSGVYVFHVSVMMNPGNREYIEIVKDGQHVIWTYPHGTSETHYVTTSELATVELTQGSEVWVRTKQTSIHGDGVIHGNTFTTFSGFLIAVTE